MNIFTITILLLIFSPQDCISFRKSYNNMLNKAKAYYKSQFGKDKTWHFLGYDVSEYPGANAEYRKINEQKWNEYYECLKIQNNNLGVHRSVTPEAVQAFEGSFVSFDCKICLNPKERAKIDAVEWYWAPLNSQHLTLIDYTEHIILSPEDKTITLYNLQEAQTGQYMCKLGGALTAPYFLTVINSTANITEVHTQYAQQGPYPKLPEIIPSINLILDTVWGDWSRCSKCDEVGKRYKFGYCTIFMKYKENSTRNERSVKNKTSTTTHLNTSTTKIKKTTITTTKIPSRKLTTTHIKNHTTISKHLLKELELFKIFKNGIPCQSHILPESIKNITSIKMRTNEVMTGYCKVRCPEEGVFEVRDKDGNVIERANNSAGIYSMLQGMPPIEPPVERMLQYAIMGEHVVISCPGNLNTDTPIRWQMGSQKLIPEIIRVQSKGRIYISIMDKINIKKAKASDSNIYSCWQNNDLAGTVRLVVEKKIQLTFNHHIMLFGMVVILAVFLYVFSRAFFGRQYARFN